MQPILQSHSPSVLPSTVTFHQRSLPGGVRYIACNLEMFGKNVRFTEDRLHKHRCAYSCTKSTDTILVMDVVRHFIRKFLNEILIIIRIAIKVKGEGVVVLAIYDQSGSTNETLSYRHKRLLPQVELVPNFVLFG